MTKINIKTQIYVFLEQAGAGKSFYTKLLILRCRLLGIEQYIIDPEREYNNLCKNLNGLLLKLGHSSDSYINIFDIREESLEEGEQGYLANKISKLIGFFNLIFGNINEEEKEEFYIVTVKFPELDEARAFLQKRPTQSTETQKFQLGGKMNLIPEGNLHAHKHHLENVNPELKDQITKKGIPVVAQSEGGIVQTAEIEKEEWTLRKEFTDKLEALYKAYQEDSSNEIAIEAGKLVCHELLKNTDDRSGLIKSVK